MTLRFLAFLTVLVLGLAACGTETTPTPASDDATTSATATSGGDSSAAAADIRQVLARQQAAWNEGDIDTFMQDYARRDSLRFASGGDVWYGWETLKQRYQRAYPDNSAMGRLAFSDVDVRVLSPDYALVFGRWGLTRSDDYTNVGGLFTLVFERGAQGWQIIHDHTSAAESLTPAGE